MVNFKTQMECSTRKTLIIQGAGGIFVFLLPALLLFGSCNSSGQNLPAPDTTPCLSAGAEDPRAGSGALLASRFPSLEAFKSVVQAEYLTQPGSGENGETEVSIVRLKHCSDGAMVISELRSGLSQKDVVKARDGGLTDRLALLALSPYVIANRMELNKIYSLARWKIDLFGEGDVAFYDLAETTAEHINTETAAYLTARDSSEKGYINTFNHFIAQAFITSCFSEEIADLIADMHELHNMPELTTGIFSEAQLSDLNNNPVDNYVDMINNEWGQEMGKVLKKKYNLHHDTHWSPQLLTNYLNDIQQYFGHAFHIGFQPFRPEDELIVRFSHKMNVIMQGLPIESRQGK